MSWNYRILKHKQKYKYSSNGDYYAIHEVMYENNKPHSCTKDPIDIVGEDIKSIKWQLDNIKKALNKPVIDYDYFVKLEKKDK